MAAIIGAYRACFPIFVISLFKFLTWRPVFQGVILLIGLAGIVLAPPNITPGQIVPQQFILDFWTKNAQYFNSDPNHFLAGPNSTPIKHS